MRENVVSPFRNALLGILFLTLSFILECSQPVLASGIVLTDEERAYLNTKSEISVLALDTFPPFSFSEEGVSKGYSVDYMRQLGLILDKDIRLVSGVRWFEALKMLREGELDIIPAIAATDERRSFIDFTPYNHVEFTTAAVFHRDFSGSSVTDRIVAVAKNTFLHSYLKRNYPAISLLITPTTNEAVLAVANGRADIAVGSAPSLDFYVRKHWLSNLTTGQVEGLSLPLNTSLPMGVRKGNQLLMSILIKAEQSMAFDQVAALREKWMRGRNHPESGLSLTSQEIRLLNRRPELRLCVDPSWMPLDAVRQGEHVGVAADFMAIISEQLNIRLNLVPSSSWRESLQLAESGQCDLFPLIMQTEGRQSYLSFTHPLVESPLVFITQVSEPYLPDLHQLKNQRIGIVKGYAYNSQLKQQYPKLEFVEVASIEQGLRMVRDGELYGYIDSLITSGYWIQNRYLGQLKVSHEIDASWPLAMGVHRELQPLVPILNKAIAQISHAKRQDIINRWISIRYESDHNWLMTLVSMLVVILFLGGVVLWYVRINKRLRQEVGRRKMAELDAINLAHTDQLTGVLNRHGAEPVIDKLIECWQREQSPVVMLLMDVDYFKRINDQYGHKRGDDTLRWMCHYLGQRIRQQDTLIRWGGEEFLILLPETELDEALELAEQYRCFVEAGSADFIVPFTVSIGVAQLQTDENFSQWYQRSDRALYQAKAQGRNRVLSECSEEAVL